MDLFHLENINSCIKYFGAGLFEDNFEMMMKSIEFLELLTSPRIDRDKIEKNIDWLRDNIERASIHDHEGNVVGYNPKNKKIVRSVLIETFRLILMKLEEQGIYTRKYEDPGLAMGKFGGS